MFHWRPRSVTSRLIVSTVEHTRPYDFLLAEGRRKGLLGCGYHFVLDAYGIIHSGRELQAVGSHSPGNNHDSVGVCLEFPITSAQMSALAGLMSSLERLYGPLSLVARWELPRSRTPASLDMDDFRKTIRKEQPPVAPIDNLTTQQQLVINYLKAGHTLSTQIAMVSLGIMSLSSRVAELRALKFDIQSEEAKDYHGRRYLRYTLNAEAPGQTAPSQ